MDRRKLSAEAVRTVHKELLLLSFLFSSRQFRVPRFTVLFEPQKMQPLTLQAWTSSPYSLPTQCMYVFPIIPTTNSDYFSQQD